MLDDSTLYPAGALDRAARDTTSQNRFSARLTQVAARRAAAAAPDWPPKLRIDGVDFWYGDTQALFDIRLALPDGAVTAFIGPSGCGKSTLLRCLNRMQDEVRGARMSGVIKMRRPDAALYDDINADDVDPPLLRRRFGWVAQKPNPFPGSVFENIAYPARISGLVPNRREERDHVERQLRRAGLWEELKERLGASGVSLSGGQQQRLCIARALATDPEVLLMDEPCGSLDPISTERIEALIDGLRGTVTIVLITHNMEQAARVADQVAFFKLGRMLESGPAASVLGAPTSKETQAYLSGRFG